MTTDDETWNWNWSEVKKKKQQPPITTYTIGAAKDNKMKIFEIITF